MGRRRGRRREGEAVLVALCSKLAKDSMHLECLCILSAYHEHVLLSIAELYVKDGGVSWVFNCQVKVGDPWLTLGLEGCMWVVGLEVYRTGIN